MIKVQNDLTTDKKDPLGMVLQDPLVHEYLHDMGVDLSRHAHPDFVFAMANGLKSVKDNTIAFERIDGCQIKNKPLLLQKKLLKLVKMYKYTGLGVNNLSSIDGRLFTRFIEQDVEKFQPVKRFITQKELDKVVLGTNFLHYKRHDKCQLLAKNSEKKATKDLFFAGSTKSYAKHGHKSGSLVSRHRTDCVKAIKKIDCRQLVRADKAFGADDYLKHIATARVTVSPWGWGESCYRDYEALMLETDVIKPKSYIIDTIPNIYKDTVFYCKPDWSDLEEVVEKCLNTWDARAEERAETKKRILEWRHPETIAKILKGLLC